MQRWVQLVLGVICMIVIASPQYVWALFTKPMTDALGASLPQLQITFSILIVVQTFLSPFQGVLVDRFGPRALLSIGTVIFNMVPTFRRMQDRTDEINRVLREQITGIRVVRAFAREPQETDRFEGANANVTSAALRGEDPAQTGDHGADREQRPWTEEIDEHALKRREKRLDDDEDRERDL